METLVVACLTAAVVVFILDMVSPKERVYSKEQPNYLKWVAMGCEVAAALLKVVYTIETIMIVCLIVAVAVVILKYFLPESRKIYVSYWIAIGSIAVAALIKAVLTMGTFVVLWFMFAACVVSVQTYLLSHLLEDVPNLKWLPIGFLAAAGLIQTSLTIGPLGAACFLGAYVSVLMLLFYFKYITVPSLVANGLKKATAWFEVIQNNGVPVLLFMMAAFVVVILIFVALKDIPVYKWVASGCIAVAVMVTLIWIWVSQQRNLSSNTKTSKK
ncbi:uncharacterized protein LOC143049328 [Mytilus galloprovincialis]|uniref:uncharacterized protein LOC143049328 n=1 Tax=Mytilus galloprovincialis TaxID=29158 RepID=UPI003F7C78B0